MWGDWDGWAGQPAGHSTWLFLCGPRTASIPYCPTVRIGLSRNLLRRPLRNSGAVPPPPRRATMEIRCFGIILCDSPCLLRRSLEQSTIPFEFFLSCRCWRTYLFYGYNIKRQKVTFVRNKCRVSLAGFSWIRIFTNRFVRPGNT